MFVWQVGKHFYNTDVDIELLREETIFEMNITTFRLKFDNSAFCDSAVTLSRDEIRLPIQASLFLEIFPFCIIYGFHSLSFYFLFIDFRPEPVSDG